MHLPTHRHVLSPSDVSSLALSLLPSGSTQSYLLIENIALAHLSSLNCSQLVSLLFAFEKKQMMTP